MQRPPARVARCRRRRDRRAARRPSTPSSTRRVEPRPGRRPHPTSASVHDFVLRDRPAHPEPAPPPADAPIFRMMDAIHDALEIELAERRPTCSSPASTSAEGGNVFGLMRGLHDRFGDRVRDTPISRDGDHGPRRRRGDGRDAPGRRDHVPRLRRRVPRPAAQPGGEDAVHDRRRRRDGADRADAVRRRSVVGQPALAEPRSAARPHPRPDRGDAVDARRHLRAAAGRDPGPEPGRVHREPPALRDEGTAAAGGPHRADRQVDRRPARHRHHARVGVADGARSRRRRRGRRRRRASRSR